MYYPAQGLFLAAGQIIFHHPFWGVWLSAGLMCAAICWMLQAWVGPVWALLGGLLAIIRIAAFSYWDNSYWGGTVAALGGALVMGALPRIMRRQRVRDALLMGLGFAILVNSRPYETIFFGLPVIIILAMWMVRKHPPLLAKRTIVPLALVILATAMFMCYYNWRTTGNALRTPYMVNLATYNSVPYFPWQQLTEPVQYHHPVMRRFYLEWWLFQYQLGRQHPIMMAAIKIYTFWIFFLGPLLTVPFLMALLRAPYKLSLTHFSWRTRILLIVCACVVTGMMLPVYFNPHYVAAVTTALYALLLISIQQLRNWKPFGRPAGAVIVRAVVSIAVVMLILRIAAPALQIPVPSAPLTWYSPDPQNRDRAGIVSDLSRQPGFHLILVRYTPDHTLSNEWIYNGADINGSKVIWARDMGAEQNARLLRYFSDRHVWVVEPDLKPVKLTPYSETRWPTRK
jgi:hypothetical protein